MDPNNPGTALLNPDGVPELRAGLYHPAFAYEALWNIGVALLVLVLDRRMKFGRGRAFALYVMGYTVGRFWIELIRTDEANEILGVRVNVWMSVLVFLGALIYFLRVRGPREFLVPAESGGTPAGAGADTGYRVVGEDEFLAYERAGAVRSAAGVAVGAGAAGGGVGDGPVGGAAGGVAGDGPVGGAVAGGGARESDDDGADLVDVNMPPLDDFADDETADDETAEDEDETAEDETVDDGTVDGATADGETVGATADGETVGATADGPTAEDADRTEKKTAVAADDGPGGEADDDPDADAAHATGRAVGSADDR